MRTWLFNRIRGITSIPAAFGSGDTLRLFASGAADNPEKPFMVVTMGIERPPLELPRSARAQAVPFIVYVHDAPGSMLNIDDCAVALKNNLPTEDAAKVGNMSLYSLWWEETGQDGSDDHYGTVVRPVRFSMMTRR